MLAPYISYCIMNFDLVQEMQYSDSEHLFSEENVVVQHGKLSWFEDEAPSDL